MKADPKKVFAVLFSLILLAGITLYLQANRYKIIEAFEGNEKIKVKIDRWTGKRYRTLYRVAATETVGSLSLKLATPDIVLPDQPDRPSPGSSMISGAAGISSPSTPVTPSKQEAPSPARAYTAKPETGPAPPEREVIKESLPALKEPEKISTKPTPGQTESVKQERASNCGFPITSSELINMALRNWCKVRQDASYQQMSQGEREALRSRTWEEACRKSEFSSYWGALPFQQRLELSRIYFEIATF